MIVETILKWFVPFVCGGIVTGVIAYIRSLKQRDNAIAEGVQCLLRAEIIREHKEYTAKGYCPVYAKDALKIMYKAYHDLKGNDVATKLYEDILDLPEQPPQNNRQEG